VDINCFILSASYLRDYYWNAHVQSVTGALQSYDMMMMMMMTEKILPHQHQGMLERT